MNAEEYAGLSRSQALKFQAYYANEYSALFPIPILKIVGLDWKFYGLVVTSISTVLVAALRTAQMFFFAAELSSKFWASSVASSKLLSGTDAFFAMLAFEGGLALISAIKTAEKEKVENWVYNVQIGLLLTISIFAGFGQSLGLVQGLGDEFIRNFSYFLVFVVGVGASVAAWLSGEILGVQLQKFSIQKKEAEEKFTEQKRIHVQNARKKFLESSTQNRNTEENDRSSPEPENRTEKRTSPRTQKRNSGISEKVSLIFSELEKYRTEQNRVLNFAELAEILRTNYPEQNFSSNGYISTKRTEWINSHPEYFIEGEKNENQS